jgi:hypothetical protein
VPRTHYDVLGVSSHASYEEVRRAYLRAARRHHPDAGGTAAHMSELNEAWRVVGDATRRRAYDARLRSAPRAADANVADIAPTVAVPWVRSVPWVLLLAALAAIFVVSAYAGGGDEVGCVVVRDGATASVPCDAPGARRVVQRVSGTHACPSGTERFQPARENAAALCMEV